MSFFPHSSPSSPPLVGRGWGWGLVAVRLVGLFADLPEVGLPRFLAARLVLLGCISLLVGAQGGEVVLALVHHLGDSGELGARLELGGLNRRGAFRLLAQIQTATIRLRKSEHTHFWSSHSRHMRSDPAPPRYTATRGA